MSKVRYQSKLIHAAVKFFDLITDKSLITLEVFGLENIPKNVNRSIVFVANHSGWSALDGALASVIISKALNGRIPRAIYHSLFDRIPMLNNWMKIYWGISASSLRSRASVGEGSDLFLIMPEGERGNFKPFWKAYQMQKWKRGFVDLAMKTNAVIVPIAITGMEEVFPNLYSFEIHKSSVLSTVPVPLPPILFNRRFSYYFLEPIDLCAVKKIEELTPNERTEIVRSVQNIVQSKLDEVTAENPLAKFARFMK